MIIDRNGQKFYAPDDATALDAAGAWTIDATALIPLAEHEAQQVRAALEMELADLEAQTTDAELIAYARSTWDVCQRIDQIKAELVV